MKDIKIARFKNPLKVKTIKRLSNNITSVIGDNFQTASELFVNEEVQRQWIILSNTEIAVTFPSSVDIFSIAVLTEELIPDRLNLTFFEIGPQLKSVSGMSKLIQNFLKFLLMAPNSNKFNTFGGGLLKIPGKTIDNSQQSIKTEIINAIQRTKNYLVNRQNKIQSMPLSEKLLDVQVLSMNIDTESNMTVSVLIKNKVGEESVISV